MLTGQDGSRIPCLCVTNRKLCRGDFLERIRRIAGGERSLKSGWKKGGAGWSSDRETGMPADAIVLREKDLTEEEYFFLAEKVLNICGDFGMPCILHTFYRAAKQLGCRRIHLPLGVFGQMEPDASFDVIGTSVHSVEQARQAVLLGASYVTAGHVFATDCKKGLPGRGLPFVREVVQAAGIPVYGIGGINAANAPSVMKEGASGVCIMSAFMRETSGTGKNAGKSNAGKSTGDA